MHVSCIHTTPNKTLVTIYKENRSWRRRLCKECINTVESMMTYSLSFSGRAPPEP